MKSKIFAALAVCAFALNTFAAVGDIKPNKPAQTGALITLLPASDGVFTIDMQRVLNEAAPQILSGKPTFLTKMNEKIDEVRAKTGLDLRQFEQISGGVTVKAVSAREYDLQPLFLARGKYSSAALIALAKLASKGKYREEKVGTRTVYIFTGAPKPASKPSAGNAKDSWFDRAFNRMIDGLEKEVAVTAFNDNTLAFGTPDRVRETIGGSSHVNPELLALANRKTNAIAAFGANLPNNLADLVDLPNDEIASIINSIKQISGAMELISGSTAVSLTTKTGTVEQAENLQNTVSGLQMLGKNFLGASKSADKQVYGRMLDNARITRNQSEVSLDLQVPQTDINILLGAK